jgi:hypothetical protein
MAAVISAGELAKRIVSRFPALHERLLDIAYANAPLPSHRHGLVGDNPEEVFADIFTHNRWNDAESASGVGSNSRYTLRLRKALPRLLRKYSVRSILDVPCGDFAWMRSVSLDPETRYLGGDIVRELVERLEKEFGSAQRRFVYLDVISSPLPQADLLICRDCFIHLSNADVRTALENFVGSDIRYILTTTYRFGRINADIATGQFRALNLEAPPFSLPPPIETIVDYIYPFPPRRLALWSRQQVAAGLAARVDRGVVRAAV